MEKKSKVAICEHCQGYVLACHASILNTKKEKEFTEFSNEGFIVKLETTEETKGRSFVSWKECMSTCFPAREFNRFVKLGFSIYKTSRSDMQNELNRRKEAAKAEFFGLTPLKDDKHICLTCGAIGKSHPKTGYCFICDTDNWEVRGSKPLIP